MNTSWLAQHGPRMSIYEQPNNVVIPQYLMTNTFGQFHFLYTEKTVTELNVDSGILY